MEIKLDTQIYPREAILHACYELLGRVFVFLKQARNGKIAVILNPKKQNKNSTLILKRLKNYFLNDLIHYALRHEINMNNKKIRESIIERALTSALPMADLEKVSDPSSLNTFPDNEYCKDPQEIKMLVSTKIAGKKITLKIRNKKNGFCPDRLIVEEVWGKNIYHEALCNLGFDHTVIDIGAHIGSFSIYAACIAEKGNTYSYEPYAENFELLKENISFNMIKNITPFNLGVSDKAHHNILYLDKFSDAAHSMLRRTKSSTIIQCTTLKKIFDDNNIRFCHLLKLDCEGEEYKILMGTPAPYFDRIGAIAMEYHDIKHKNNDFQRTCYILKRNGFQYRIRLSPPSRHKKYDSGILFAVKV